MQPKISIAMIRNIVLGASEYGVPVNVLCSNIGIEKSTLKNIHDFLPFETAIIAWEKALELTWEKDLGIKVGCQIKPHDIGAISHLLTTSQNLVQAWESFVSYSETSGCAMNFKFSENKDYCFLHILPQPYWEIVTPSTMEQIVDSVLGSIYNVLNIIASRKIHPAQIYLKSNSYYRREKYLLNFHCHDIIESDEYKVAFSKKDMEIPVISQNSELYKLYQNRIASDFMQLIDQKPFLNIVKRKIFTDYWPSLPTIESISDDFCMSAKTLQRKLKDENITFKQLILELRMEFARELLLSGRFSISAIAHKLLYAEVSVFTRAFTNYYGVSPSIYKDSRFVA